MRKYANQIKCGDRIKLENDGSKPSIKVVDDVVCKNGAAYLYFRENDRRPVVVVREDKIVEIME